MKNILNIKNTFLVTALTAFAFIAFVDGQNANATSTAGWNPGNIIDDAIFTNNGSMNVSTIENFLNSKVPVCDTSGTQVSEYGGGTRSQWGQTNYGQSTFICLKDYKENDKSSAQIIYDVAQEFKINPQVLIVLLQKEQGLVTDTWPLNVQYRTATGYGCPDTAACDSQYFGLTNQLTWAARMFRAIINDSPTWYTPYVLGQNYIGYSPDASCGGSDVYIQNRATQALYNYTPYQPNSGALAVGYGTAYCGAYGNRNFYLYFLDWFKSTTAINGSVTLSKNMSIDKDPSKIYVGDSVTASYEVSNESNSPVLAGGLGVCARLDNKWFDFGFKDQNEIAANGKIQISFTKKITKPGTLNIFVCSYHASIGGWANSIYPYDSLGTIRAMNITTKNNPQLTSNVSLSNTKPLIGEAVTATFTIKNNSMSDYNIGQMIVAVRDPQGKNRDFPSDSISNGGTIIPAGGTYTFSKSRTFTTAGSHTFFLANYDAARWSSSYPSSSSSSLSRSGSFVVKDNPVLISNVTISPTKPIKGEPVTASVTIQNLGAEEVSAGIPVFATRDKYSNNYDFPSSSLIVPGGETITYSKTRIFDKEGDYNFSLRSYYNGVWMNGTYPRTVTTDLTSSGNIKVTNNPAITSLSLQSTKLDATSTKVTATMNIKNTNSNPINIDMLIFAARDPDGKNVDFPSNGEITVPPNSTYTLTSDRTFTRAGVYKIFIADKHDGVWDMQYPSSLQGINRTQYFTVQ